MKQEDIKRHLLFVFYTSTQVYLQGEGMKNKYILRSNILASLFLQEPLRRAEGKDEQQRINPCLCGKQRGKIKLTEQSEVQQSPATKIKTKHPVGITDRVYLYNNLENYLI